LQNIYFSRIFSTHVEFILNLHIFGLNFISVLLTFPKSNLTYNVYWGIRIFYRNATLALFFSCGRVSALSPHGATDANLQHYVECNRKPSPYGKVNCSINKTIYVVHYEITNKKTFIFLSFCYDGKGKLCPY
jgi:hypothetical protein